MRKVLLSSGLILCTVVWMMVLGCTAKAPSEEKESDSSRMENISSSTNDIPLHPSASGETELDNGGYPAGVEPYYDTNKSLIPYEEIGHWVGCPLRKGVDERYDELYSCAVEKGKQIPEWDTAGISEEWEMADSFFARYCYPWMEHNSEEYPNYYPNAQENAVIKNFYGDKLGEYVYYLEFDFNVDGDADYMLLWEDMGYAGFVNGRHWPYATFLCSTPEGYREYPGVGPSWGSVRTSTIAVMNQKVNGMVSLRLSNEGCIASIQREIWVFEEDFSSADYYYFNPEGGYDGSGGFEWYDPESAALPWK